MHTAEKKFMNRRTFAITLGTVVAGSVTVSGLFAQDQPKKADHPGSCTGTETLSNRRADQTKITKKAKAKNAKKPKRTDEKKT